MKQTTLLAIMIVITAILGGVFVAEVSGYDTYAWFERAIALFSSDEVACPCKFHNWEN